MCAVAVSLFGMSAVHFLNAADQRKDSPMSNTKSSDLRMRVMEKARQLEATPTKKMVKTGWQDTTVDVHSASGTSWLSWFSSTSRPKPMRVAAKRSCYVVLDGDFPADIVVTTFVTERGAIWLGPEQDFYVEIESVITGGKKWGQAILWCESLMNKRPNEKSDLATGLARFEKDVDGSSLAVACNGGPPPPTEAFLKRLTDLGGVLFGIYGSAPNSGGDVVAVQVEGNAVRLDLKGALDHPNGRAWIDIKTKKLLKAEKDGKQVFPK